MTTPDPSVPDVPIVAVDRPAPDLTDALAALQKQVDDLTTTVTYRASRGNTGDIVGTLLPTPPADALFLLGQTVSRATYPVLWQWVVDNNPGGFGAGDGSTTFVLPNMQGRVLVGVGTLGSDVYALADLDGATSHTTAVTLTTANMPSHTHSVSVNDHNSHNHNITTNNQGGHSHGCSGDGNHTAHQPSGFGFAGGGGAGVQYNNTTDGFHAHNINAVADHGHGGSADSQGVSSHVVNQSGAGSGNSFNVVVNTQQPSFAVNVMIWT